MGTFFDNFNLGQLMENEDALEYLASTSLENGNEITGYYDCEYINHHFGDAQMVFCTRKVHNDKKLKIDRWLIHSSGNCVWDVKVSELLAFRKSEYPGEKIIGISNLKSEDFAVVDVVNADVLPCYHPGEVIKMQMIALPIDEVYYLKNEEEYLNVFQNTYKDIKVGISNGAVLSTGLIHAISEDGEIDDLDFDNSMLIKGTVEYFVPRKAIIAEGIEVNYIACVIDTVFGDIAVIHYLNQVKKEERENLCEGSILFARVILQGDVAIYDYEKGFVKDLDNNLKLVKYSMSSYGDPERLRAILSDSSVYYSEFYDSTYVGPDEIIDRFKYVIDNRIYKYKAYIGEITGYTTEEEGMYTIGTKCILMVTGDKEYYESIVFIEQDNDSNITRIIVTSNENYLFKNLESLEDDIPLNTNKVNDNYKLTFLESSKYTM